MLTIANKGKYVVKKCQKHVYMIGEDQTDKHFSSLKKKVWIFVTENCLEIEDVLNFESLEPLAG